MIVLVNIYGECFLKETEIDNDSLIKSFFCKTLFVYY